MHGFKNILLVSRGLAGEEAAFAQALKLLKDNKAALTILIQYPILPKSFADYKESYENFLLNTVENTLLTALSEVEIKPADIAKLVRYEFSSDDKHSINIVQRVQRNNHDLVLKQSETSLHENGFKSIDMSLLRKCPSPVWIARPIEQMHHIGVAIDPESPDDLKGHLAENLLQIASIIADQRKIKLSIIACWNYAFEDEIRKNDFINIPEDQISNIVEEARSMNLDTLYTIIKHAKISENYTLHHIRGIPNKAIPKFVAENNIDLLVMGTIARSGISSFLMGNTAEDILRTVACSVLALKPHGFVSPIK